VKKYYKFLTLCLFSIQFIYSQNSSINNGASSINISGLGVVSSVGGYSQLVDLSNFEEILVDDFGVILTNPVCEKIVFHPKNFEIDKAELRIYDMNSRLVENSLVDFSNSQGEAFLNLPNSAYIINLFWKNYKLSTTIIVKCLD
jgi:hypothetical protein